MLPVSDLKGSAWARVSEEGWSDESLHKHPYAWYWVQGDRDDLESFLADQLRYLNAHMIDYLLSAQIRDPENVSLDTAFEIFVSGMGQYYEKRSALVLRTSIAPDEVVVRHYMQEMWGPKMRDRKDSNLEPFSKRAAAFIQLLADLERYSIKYPVNHGIFFSPYHVLVNISQGHYGNTETAELAEDALAELPRPGTLLKAPLYELGYFYDNLKHKCQSLLSSR